MNIFPYIISFTINNIHSKIIIKFLKNSSFDISFGIE